MLHRLGNVGAENIRNARQIGDGTRHECDSK
jgi:hypothetical protein